jgi:hypothetical protein
MKGRKERKERKKRKERKEGEGKEEKEGVKKQMSNKRKLKQNNNINEPFFLMQSPDEVTSSLLVHFQRLK